MACEKLWKSFDRVPIYNCVDNAKSYFKSQLQAIAHKFYFNFKPHKNRCSVFSKKQFSILKELSHDKSIYISKPDKGNSIVVLNKQDYIAKVNRILSDKTKFQVIDNVEEQKLIMKLEDKLNHVLRGYKKDGRITADFYNSCFASGTNLGVLYGLPKVHKTNCPIRPILSACSMHNFNLGKALVPLISHLSSTQHTLKNSAEFVNFISSINNANSLYMCSLDVESLYTNIPVQECIEIVLKELYNRSTMYHGFSRVDVKKLLELAVSDTYFKFDNAIYKQVDGLSMGSAMSPVLANIFLNRFESDYLLNCPLQYRPFHYKRFLDDTFILFSNAEQATDFFHYFNSKHSNITFTFEGEQNNFLPFLDVTVERTGNNFSTSVFRKTTFTGQGLNYFSDILRSYKISSITTLINRAYILTSSYTLFHKEITFLRQYFMKNLYPEKLFNLKLRTFLSKKYELAPLVVSTVPRLTIHLEVPYIGYQTNKMIAEIKCLSSKFYPPINTLFYSRNSHRLGNHFRNSSRSSNVFMCSKLTYKYTCDSCQLSYIGNTSLQMFMRMHKHKGTSFRTNRLLSNPEESAIRSHCYKKDHLFKFSNFSIIDRCNKEDLKLLESLYTHKLQPSLNNYQIPEKLSIAI